MGKKLTFKEYLDSKDVLIKAIANVPRQTIEYSVLKYCKLVVGECKEKKEYINLKPNQTVLVEWVFSDLNDPTISSVQFRNVKNIKDGQRYPVFWPADRVQNWLARNSKQS